VTDIYGIGVNLAARVCTLAEAGETVATAQLRDLLSDTLDADIEDLGDCHLKHVDRPVRAYRLGPALHESSVPTTRSYASALQASIAVIPFTNLLADTEYQGIGDLLADGVIDTLSMSPGLRVVSRLSSGTFKARSTSLAEIANRLDVRYVVSGTYAVSGPHVTVAAELADAPAGTSSGRAARAANGATCWRRRASSRTSSRTPSTASSSRRRRRAPRRGRSGAEQLRALPGGISMMHRASADDFELSRRLLESLAERHPRVAAPHAWLGKWYVLRTIQGATDDLAKAASVALDHTQRALDLEPASALSLAIEGFVYCHLKKDLTTGLSRLRQACADQPQRGLRLAVLCRRQGLRGHSDEALGGGAPCAVAFADGPLALLLRIADGLVRVRRRQLRRGDPLVRSVAAAKSPALVDLAHPHCCVCGYRANGASFRRRPSPAPARPGYQVSTV
jgi:TolB-like protein